MPLQFHQALKAARESSYYPRRRDFARAVDLSDGGLGKLESGDRTPGAETLENIIELGGIPQDVANNLRTLRNAALAEKMGIKLINSTPVDVSALSNRIITEVEYNLKQANQRVTQHLRKVLLNRIQLILGAALRN